jgi:Domain of unknown function (DUF305)
MDYSGKSEKSSHLTCFLLYETYTDGVLFFYPYHMQKDTSTTPTPTQKDTCCTGHSFWFWAAIRIAIVVAMIVGAFILGSQCGRSGDGYSRHMMNPAQYGEKMVGQKGMRGMDPAMQKNMDMSHDPMQMSMADMSTMMAGKTGDALDKAFLEGMIPHHQGAVDMARMLAGSRHPELVKFGADIIATQQKEIDQMNAWMKEWGYTQTGGTNSGNMMSGMHMMPDGTMMIGM